MNREILFRGKRIDNGEWVYGIPLCDWADCSLKCKNQHKGELLTFYGWEDHFHEYDEFEVDPSTVGQYTDLTDKNGKKIFEGDIIKGKEKQAYAVEYSEDIASFTASSTDGLGYYVRPGMNRGTMAYYEVIGNIHDNPELLGGETND